ncbi:hypothetical protein HR45_07735 [Shewanella mangrovi]|uniref:HTH gntR-type domain-containing protein n=1 Tax=Shewanella mangrovi TaxID=1515746 RepID=A0A094JEU4_9GAMM|nr:GntR family transcriptional regulator [Shewanella mangrovi]KFZ37742.1 hypothetical protein HR45_07735 [Shewanella mangrovi]
MSIVVKTLSEQAYEIIRERILSNDILPSKPLRQDSLSQELGVSKIPLREALTRLEQDGFLISHPNRGFLVRPLTMSEAEDVFHLRILLESEAASSACVIATDADKKAVAQAFAEFRTLTDKTSHRRVAINREFHLAMTRPINRGVSQRIITKLHFLSERYVRMHLEPPHREESAFNEHQRIFDAWMAADATAVKTLLEEHNRQVIRDLRQQIPSE